MRWAFPIAVLLAYSPASAQTKSDDIKQAAPPAWARVSEPLPVPDDARGVAFFRRQDTQMHLSKDGQVIFSNTLVRLTHANALQLGNISLAWNPASGKPAVHAVKVHRGGNVRDVLADTKFEILRRENQLETAMLDGVLTAVLRVPDLRVGDDLELSYSLPSQDPTLKADSFGMLLLAGNPSPGRFSLRLSWEDGQEPAVRFTPDLTASIIREQRAVAVNFEMPGPLSPPKDAPPRYAWQRIIEFSDFQDWHQVSIRIAPLFEKAATLPSKSPVKVEAALIAAAHSDAKGRAAAALKLVQQQVRYVYVGFNGGNITPVSAEETWQRRYGDCKGKTALLLALLHELRIPAEVVLVSNAGLDDGLDKRLPSPGLFDHVLVRVHIDGENWWLDGTLPHVFPLSRAPVMPYRWVLPVNQIGAPIERIDWKPEARPDELFLHEIDARGGFSEPAAKREVFVKRGLPAIVEYYQYSSLTDEQLLSAFQQELEGSSGWNKVERVSWKFDTGTMASVLEITGRGPVDWDDDGDGSRSLSLPGGGFSPPGRRQRGTEQDQTAPFYNKPGFNCHVTTVRLPTATAPKDWSFNKAFDTTFFEETFRRSFEKRDGAIRMIRSNRTLRTEFDPQSAAKDNERLATFDNSMAWIYYDPGSTDRPGPRETVPATYEIDWLADDSACLSPQRSSK